MSLELDGRRRDMLAEMGIRLYARDPAAVSSAPMDTAAAALAGPGKPVAPAVPAVAPAEAALAARAAVVNSLQWDALADAVANCRACKLCEGRTQAVFGVGGTQPDWLIVGEAADENEDLQGEPFAGEAGELLDNMLKALGLARGNKVFITNVLKCRPPGDRAPEPGEVAQCELLLRRQVELLRPRIILAMGRFAARTLLASTEPFGRLRGRPHDYHGVPLVVTYHPSYLLRNLSEKARAWADLCLAQESMRPSRPQIRN
jgi:uracil-DNA glycosylase